MKEVVIVSGKGGVGKSAISASLGAIFMKNYKVVLADTDVDAPNLNLFFSSRPRYSKVVEASEKASIDAEKCEGCLECVVACRFSAIAVSADAPVLIPYFCEGCGACSIVCPAGAIEINSESNGNIDISDIDSTVIVSGELRIGESSSGRLVDEVKRVAKEEAGRINADLIITDGPPGTGCPVISALKGSDYVIAVTEPTPAALSDLGAVYDVIRHFGLPSGIVINKAGLHPASESLIRDFIIKDDIPILAAISYDISVPEATARTMPVAEAYPDAPASKGMIRLAGAVTKAVLSHSEISGD
ncbi:MAG: ATP-binding protein [Candidatus Sulfobium sp.]